MAETNTDLSGPSVVSLTAVTVTVPALVVSPDAMVSVFALESVKPAPEAATVSVTAALDARFKRAVTVETPPDSDTDEDESANVATGVASSSVKVSDAPVTVTVSESARRPGHWTPRPSPSPSDRQHCRWRRSPP